MSHTVKTLPGAQVELVITVTPAEYEKALAQAANRLANRVAVKGFRTGHIPLDILKKEVGEMGILSEALESIVQGSFFEAVQAEKLDTLGMPQINVEKVAPGNDVVYKAVVSLMPTVELPDFGSIKIEKKVKAVDEKVAAETLEAIQNMHGVEKPKEGAAEGKDMVLIDMDMLLDNVPLDGGQAKDYRVYLGEQHYIPGFNEKMVGATKGEKREFSLEFPETHYQKMIAGKKVDFKVSVKDVFERIPAELNDDFAKKLGQESVEKLKDLILSNLATEAEQKADKDAEVEIFEKVIEKTKFSEIPEVLINTEKEKMFYELKRDIEKMGMTIEQYLNDIKKKEDELFKEFTLQATKRAQAALVSRQVAKENNILVSEDEIDLETAMIKQAYEKDAEAQENLKKKEVRHSIATILQNKKVVALLKEKMVSEKK
jgi:trigger factor